MGNQELNARVEREKLSHEEDDVLSRAYALKNRFSHIWTVTERVRNAENAILSDSKGMTVLDYGCGRGEFSLKMLGYGAKVFGIDISQVYVDEAKKSCLREGYDVSQFNFQTMDAHNLSFADETFDFVVGNGILHHLDYPTALSEIDRVLKPGGRAIFQEPLSGNPLLGLLRLLTPSARTEDERPFTASDLRYIDTGWNVKSTYYGLLTAPVSVFTSLVLRPWPDNWLIRIARHFENKLNRFNFLRSWNQYVLFDLVKMK